MTATNDLERQLRSACVRHEREPHNLAILREICDVLIALEREDELVDWADRALALGTQDHHFFAVRAFALDLLGRHGEAVETRTRAPSMADNPALAQLRLGYSLMMAGHFAHAIQLLDEARRPVATSTPNVLASAEQLLGEAMLKAGDPRGFKHWTRRNDSGDAGSYRPAGVPAWDGESDLRGRRVLVVHQLGFGDNFLLGACVADWRAVGAQVMITCDPQIHALMQASLPDCEVVSAARPLQTHGPLPDAVCARVEAFAPHLYATLLHLPVLRAAQTTCPYRFEAYLRAPPAKRQIAAAWAQQLRAQRRGKKLVGLFWDCGQRHLSNVGSSMRCWAARRSLPLDALNRLVTDPALTGRIRFVNLHHPLAEAAAGMPPATVERYLPGIHLFDDTAACIGELDAVFAVDSAVANLAAMMGKLTCVPVNTSGDWRWGHSGSTSNWIESATVLRQTQEGDWNPVVRDAVAWLAAL
ncbi:tetratricopeptide repeat protein [Paraburkholderia aromaticivorans]|uniref:tetratricopeptide repeat protein n=1 Tax=Paraburkholderia aromaticivorans TaxID=2026199 RepID=UPI0038BC887A